MSKERLEALLNEAACIYDAPDMAQVAEHLVSNNVVVVVRCKDCKHAKGNLIPIGICYCLKYRDVRQGGDFCNYGDRRADNEQREAD
jgi:hypothetical protein